MPRVFFLGVETFHWPANPNMSLHAAAMALTFMDSDTLCPRGPNGRKPIIRYWRQVLPTRETCATESSTAMNVGTECAGRAAFAGTQKPTRSEIYASRLICFHRRLRASQEGRQFRRQIRLKS
jgi:hypothetical protein